MADSAGARPAAAEDENTNSLHPSALRERIPEMGLKEYWYPAIEAKKVKSGKPTTVKMLGQDLSFFRGKDGNVVATSSTCPHRGASLAHGKCHFAGTITCPYHGWTFDETGACVAVLGEGPDSRIPGMPDARVRSYPTQTHKGIVFAWMGESDPAPIEEDVPPQFFDDEFLIQVSVTSWDCNWRPAFENLLDSHVFYVHRNSVHLMMMDAANLLIASKMGPRRPRPRVVNGRALMYPPGALGFADAFVGTGAKHAAEKAATTEVKTWPPAPEAGLQDSYPGLDGAQWPKSARRVAWHKVYGAMQKVKPTPFKRDPLEIDAEWKDAHLPSTFQVSYSDHIYSRVTVPIDADTSRVFYFHATMPLTRTKRIWDQVYFEVFQNWMMNYNFSGQDEKVVRHQAYDTPETFSATDVFPLTLRKLILENARDFHLKDGHNTEWPDAAGAASAKEDSK
jgi:nitrite reductase/ring-hydroxylating ferredoxin subunit